MQSKPFRLSGSVAIWGLVALVLASTGCSRLKYRLAADKEVKYLIEQKSNDPRWQFHNYTIGMDPRSRYFDPTDPDGPPMPYDDPAAHAYMHCVDGKKGYPCWHMNGDWYDLENPQWRNLLAQYNEITDDGAVKLSMKGSACLAQVHSTDYRSQIEQLYLVALDVSAERYAFDTLFFGNSSTIFTHLGQRRVGSGGAEQNTLFEGAAGNDKNYRITKQFSAGAQLLVGFANSFTWQFAGPDTNTTTSLLNFSLVQPLLRNGGRVIALETLTRAERTLLAGLRTFQRYRQGFYTVVAVGANGAPQVQTISRAGGFLGGTGLTGFTGTGAGGIGAVAAGAFGIGVGGAAGVGNQGTGGFGGFASGGVGLVGGYVGLVQQLQQVRNAEENLNSLLRTLGLLEAYLDAGQIDIGQVDQLRQQIVSQRAAVLQAQVSFQSGLDTFKQNVIDWPPDIPVSLDDGLLAQFQFLDPKTIDVQHLIEAFIKTVGELPASPDVAELRKAIDVLDKLRDRVGNQVKGSQADLDQLATRIPDRKSRMNAEQAKAFDQEVSRLTESLADIGDRFDEAQRVFERLKGRIGSEPTNKTTDDIVTLSSGMLGLTQELSLVKARARLESVTIPDLKLASDHALDIARAYRLDWMNNRAQLVDTWRLIAFNANRLMSGLDITFSGDLGTVGKNPAAFNGQNGSLSVGARFDAPFTRRLERNNYRQALITYQQQRRALYQYVDGVNLVLRSLIRQLDQFSILCELQRDAVAIAVRRVDKAREDLNKPPAPVQPGQQAETLGPTVALNIITATRDLTDAQNNFMSVVLNYYAVRMLLYRELGIMELDDCGMWIDRPFKESDWLTDDDSPMPPEVPAEWMEAAGIDVSGLDHYQADHEHGAQGISSGDLLPWDSTAAETIPGSRGKDSPAKPASRTRMKPSGDGTPFKGLAPEEVPLPGKPDADDWSQLRRSENDTRAVSHAALRQGSPVVAQSRIGAEGGEEVSSKPVLRR